MSAELKECGACVHLNLARCPSPGRHWCEQVNEAMCPLDRPPCPHWTLRRCGNCVVWNGCEGDAVGSCSVMGERRADETPCRRWFGRTELGRALYGKG